VQRAILGDLIADKQTDYAPDRLRRGLN